MKANHHHFVYSGKLVVTGRETCPIYTGDLLEFEFYYNEDMKCNIVESKVILRTRFKKT